MSEQIMRGLLQTRLLTLGWQDQTVFEGKSFKPTAGVPYQLVNTIFPEAEAMSLRGSNRQEGTFQVRLMYPLELVGQEGIGEAWARAEAIQTLFPRTFSMTAAGVKVMISRKGQITRLEPQGDRDVTIIRIRFRDR